MEHLGLILAIALASAAISYTITSGSVMGWLRVLIAPIHPKLEQLIWCPWCTSHYPTIIILIIVSVFKGIYFIAIPLFGTGIIIGISGWILAVMDLLITWFMIQGLIGIIHYFITFYNGANGSFRRALIKAQRKWPEEYLDNYYLCGPKKEIRLNFLTVSGCSEDLIPIIRTVNTISEEYPEIEYYEGEIVTELWPTDRRVDI